MRWVIDSNDAASVVSTRRAVTSQIRVESGGNADEFMVELITGEILAPSGTAMPARLRSKCSGKTTPQFSMSTTRDRHWTSMPQPIRSKRRATSCCAVLRTRSRSNVAIKAITFALPCPPTAKPFPKPVSSCGSLLQRSRGCEPKNACRTRCAEGSAFVTHPTRLQAE